MNATRPGDAAVESKLPERPRLRGDLVTARTVFRGEPSVVVADRSAGRYVRFGEGADEILRLLDGTRSVEDLATELGRRVGAEFPRDRARAFLAGLAERGFLEGVPGRPKRRRWNPLALRLPLFDPDRLAGALRGLGRLLFSGPGIGAAVLTAAAGLATLALHGPSARIPALDDAWTLGAFYAAASVALTLHELGHALALKSRGGVVREAGVLLLFGMPCLYVDVSDAWLLPTRRDRLIVSSAGLIVELGLLGAACLALALAPLHGPGAVAAFAVATVCGIRSIAVNLNPLVRLDGYYVLSDLLGIPNLRPRAFAALAGWARSGAAKARGDGTERAATRGERTVLLVYGALALPYGVLLVGGLLWVSARWLVARGGVPGLAAWAVVAALVLARAVGGAVRTLRTVGKGGDAP